MALHAVFGPVAVIDECSPPVSEVGIPLAPAEIFQVGVPMCCRCRVLVPLAVQGPYMRRTLCSCITGSSAISDDGAAHRDGRVVVEVLLSEDSREVEAEAVDVEFLDHEVKSIHDDAATRTMIGAQTVADTGVVPVGLTVGAQGVPGGRCRGRGNCTDPRLPCRSSRTWRPRRSRRTSAPARVHPAGVANTTSTMTSMSFCANNDHPLEILIDHAIDPPGGLEVGGEGVPGAKKLRLL